MKTNELLQECIDRKGLFRNEADKTSTYLIVLDEEIQFLEVTDKFRQISESEERVIEGIHHVIEAANTESYKKSERIIIQNLDESFNTYLSAHQLDAQLEFLKETYDQQTHDAIRSYMAYEHITKERAS